MKSGHKIPHLAALGCSDVLDCGENEQIHCIRTAKTGPAPGGWRWNKPRHEACAGRTPESAHPDGDQNK